MAVSALTPRCSAARRSVPCAERPLRVDALRTVRPARCTGGWGRGPLSHGGMRTIRGRHWVAILGAAAARAALRAELREVALPEGATSPSPGDRVAVVTLPAVALVGV